MVWAETTPATADRKASAPMRTARRMRSGVFAKHQGGRRLQRLARRQPRVQRQQRNPGEWPGDEEPGIGRQVDLEDAAREELADDRRTYRREQAGDGAHGE